ESADALTNRVRFGVETGRLRGTSLLAEAVWLEDVVDDYNSTTNGELGYPVVADPGDIATVNRFALTNESLEGTTLTLGRQRIVLDDARFVGNVVWRQNEQTFDGLRARVARNGWAADMTYANQVNRIFGPDSAVGEWEGDMVLANVSREFDWGKVVGFGYLLDLDDAAAASTDTFGLKLQGSAPLGSVTGTYTAAVARQSDRGANPADFDESYYLLELGVALDRTSVALGHEVLGGDGTVAFSTPLATLHAFQGWADKFLATPAAGMEDNYVKVGYALGARGPFENLSALGFFHQFRADAGGADFGDELDVMLVARLARMTYTLKYASYRAEGLFTDTDKLWLSMDFAF
ncbi:MAG: alginate export family protein, partial [Gammaproteobacteria bacterium]|nr:alginate export family protein [Gammaproteobacteria bacterium]